jgi:hypothetical protein
MRISYTALEALLWPLRMAKVEHPKGNQPLDVNSERFLETPSFENSALVCDFTVPSVRKIALHTCAIADRSCSTMSSRGEHWRILAPSFSVATCSVPCAAHGRTAHGKVGGATTHRIMRQPSF